jgi:hypothetical protein
MARSASKLKSPDRPSPEGAGRESGYTLGSTASMPPSNSGENNRRNQAVPPPPPTAEDGSAHLSVPPHEPLPSMLGRSLQQRRSGRRGEPKAFWVLLAVLFLFGTAVTLYFQR